MKTIKKLLTTCMLIAISISATKAATIIVSSNILTNKTWFRGNTYILQGFIYVKNGATLTIQSGTIIKGDKATKGSLIVTRGCQLIANGTETQPIVFTSNQPVGSKAPGDWGGVIILGNGVVNSATGTAIIEGGFTAPDGEYGGGGSPNNSESSGSLKYIRIEYAGVPFQPNSEINGLTFGGVGSGTVVEHIQVSYSGDDAFEWFGGAVNCKWLVSYSNVDDDIDTDFGYSGKIQFAVVIRNPVINDPPSLSNGIESDNANPGTTNTPNTTCLISNLTVVGGNPSVGTGFNAAYRLRRFTQQSIYNSVAVGFASGLHIDGTGCEGFANSNLLQYQNNIIAGASTPYNLNSGSTFNFPAYLAAQGGNNDYPNSSDALLTDPFNLSAPNCLPQAGSPALSGASFSNARLTNPFFTSVNYRGAFGSSNWAKCWTEFDPQNQTYATNPIDNAPAASITTGDPLTHCAGINVTFNANTGAGLSYQWYKSTTPQSGATGTSFTTAAAGGWKVQVTNNKGCQKYSNVLTTVVSQPSVTATLNNDKSLCVNNPVSLSASSATATGYQWQLNGGNIGGATAPNYGATAAGVYKVVVTDAAGCTKLSSGKTVTSTMATVTTSINGNSSICPPQTTQLLVSPPVSGLSYQWQVNTGSWINIGGATQTSYTVTSPSSYRVRAISSLGCPAKNSATIIISNSCKFVDESSDISTGNSIHANVYPNPFNQEAVLTFELNGEKSVTIHVYDVTGKMVSEIANGTFNEGINEIRFSSEQLTTGLYFAKISVDGIATETIKLNVQKN